VTLPPCRRLGPRREKAGAGALRAVMLDMLDKGERVDPDTKQVVFTYAHPLFWAPFALIGDGHGAPAPAKD
jgi:CHAT domain-containing protein